MGGKVDRNPVGQINCSLASLRPCIPARLLSGKGLPYKVRRARWPTHAPLRHCFPCSLTRCDLGSLGYGKQGKRLTEM
jgi:hypothetical protein